MADINYFEDRKDAGQLLAHHLSSLKIKNPIVVALPRGGVPVGYEVAKALNAPLTVMVVRKIGAPYQKEYGVGAVAENNVLLLDEKAMSSAGFTQKDLEPTIAEEKEELKRRVSAYRGNKPLPNLRNHTVILVDDGLATGVTARVALLAIKTKNPKKIIAAFPVCAHDTYTSLKESVDEAICLITPPEFQAVGQWYRYFEQTNDEEVTVLLAKAQQFGKKKS